MGVLAGPHRCGDVGGQLPLTSASRVCAEAERPAMGRVETWSDGGGHEPLTRNRRLEALDPR